MTTALPFRVATNATLVLSGVNASNQGTYTVFVSDGYGGVMSSGAVLTVYTRTVTGQWDFLHGTCGQPWDRISNMWRYDESYLVSIDEHQWRFCAGDGVWE